MYTVQVTLYLKQLSINQVYKLKCTSIEFPDENQSLGVIAKSPFQRLELHHNDKKKESVLQKQKYIFFSIYYFSQNDKYK